MGTKYFILQVTHLASGVLPATYGQLDRGRFSLGGARYIRANEARGLMPKPRITYSDEDVGRAVPDLLKQFSLSAFHMKVRLDHLNKRGRDLWTGRGLGSSISQMVSLHLSANIKLDECVQGRTFQINGKC